jgi:geranylgeranyl diphosphate synthase type I
MSDFHSYKPEIASELTHMFKDASQVWPESWAQRFFSDTLEYALRGRMIRGSAVIHTWQAFQAPASSNIPSAVMRAAACIEVFESALLIHDDIIDRDMLRRGKPSMHAALSQTEKHHASSSSSPSTSPSKTVNSAHLGESLALILGDILYFFIYQELGNLPIREGQRLALMQTFSRLALATGLGQTVDIAAGFQVEELTQSEILKMYQDKTASYSFCLPLQFGAILSNQSAQTIEKLQRVGISLGQLYQLADDHKGIFGDSEETGKPEGGDIREGKQTLHRLFALQTLPADTLMRFTQLYGKHDLTSSELKEVRTFLANEEVLSSIKALQKKLENELQSQLKSIDSPEKLVRMLTAVWQLAVLPLHHFPVQKNSL